MSTSNSQSLAGQRALVTGATSGIGRAIAIELAREGADVIVHGRDAGRGARVVEEIKKAGGKASFLGADLDKAGEVVRLAKEAGDVDILINNAGFAMFAPTAEFPVDRVDALFAANVRAPFLLVAAIAPKMVARKRGSIVNIGSMAGTIGMAGGAAYGATKAALSSLTRSWAAEFSASGVRVNLVAPGPVHTLVDEPARDLISTLGGTTAMKRFASTEEIANVVVFIASPRASYITGATIAADGGRTAI